MDRSPEIPVLVIFGSTASGKTAIAERVFADEGPFAGLIGLISADSMQVYRGMDIGTAKPNPSLLQRLPHELIDVRNPSDQFSVADFVSLADEACSRIHSSGRVPVILGGTGFYIRNFLYGLPVTPPSDPDIRAKLQERLACEGSASLYAELFARDPKRASALHPNDGYRITRALEVCAVSGTTFESFALPTSFRPGYRFLVLVLTRDRSDLYDRIDRRVDEMFSQGLADEVARLVAAGYGPDDPGMRAIGYREFFDGNDLNRDSLAVKACVAANTKQYAKRQETYVRSLPGVVSVPADAFGAVSWIIGDFLASPSGT